MPEQDSSEGQIISGEIVKNSNSNDAAAYANYVGELERLAGVEKLAYQEGQVLTGNQSAPANNGELGQGNNVISTHRGLNLKDSGAWRTLAALRSKSKRAA